MSKYTQRGYELFSGIDPQNDGGPYEPAQETLDCLVKWLVVH